MTFVRLTYRNIQNILWPPIIWALVPFEFLSSRKPRNTRWYSLLRKTCIWISMAVCVILVYRMNLSNIRIFKWRLNLKFRSLHLRSRSFEQQLRTELRIFRSKRVPYSLSDLKLKNLKSFVGEILDRLSK